MIVRTAYTGTPPTSFPRRRSCSAETINPSGIRSRADNHLIELAVAGNADWIVTGNARDIAAGELTFDSFRIGTPGAWLKRNE